MLTDLYPAYPLTALYQLVQYHMILAILSQISSKQAHRLLGREITLYMNYLQNGVMTFQCLLSLGDIRLHLHLGSFVQN